MSEQSESKDKEYKVTPAGSLGLLAMGDVGLRAWRKAREEAGMRTPQSLRPLGEQGVGKNEEESSSTDVNEQKNG